MTTTDLLNENALDHAIRLEAASVLPGLGANERVRLEAAAGVWFQRAIEEEEQ